MLLMQVLERMMQVVERKYVLRVLNITSSDVSHVMSPNHVTDAGG
jgi:hypothetical protein